MHCGILTEVVHIDGNTIQNSPSESRKEKYDRIGSVWRAAVLFHSLDLVYIRCYRHHGDVIQGPPRIKRKAKRKTSSDASKFESFTNLINSMLDPEKYDMRLRPDFGGETYLIGGIFLSFHFPFVSHHFHFILWQILINLLYQMRLFASVKEFKHSKICF